MATLLLVGGVAHGAGWQWVDGQRVKNYMNEGSGLWLIDVRSAPAYEASHVEGSVNIPSDALMHKTFSAQKMLVLVDDSLGQKSARGAAEMLAKKGHERVSVLEGGIAGWKKEGLPIVETKEPDRGVTAAELKWALANSIPMKIYDLRDAETQKQGAVKNSESVPGKTVAERVEKLKKLLVSDGKKKDLAERIRKPQPVVLIFAATEDGAGYAKNVLQSAKDDIRYLIGGYESTVVDKLRKQQTTGSCPTCPAEREKTGQKID